MIIKNIIKIIIWISIIPYIIDRCNAQEEYNLWEFGRNIEMNFKTFTKSPDVKIGKVGSNSNYSCTISEGDSIIFIALPSYTIGTNLKIITDTVKGYPGQLPTSVILIKDRIHTNIFHGLGFYGGLGGYDTNQHKGLIYLQLDKNLNHGNGGFVDTIIFLSKPAVRLCAVNHNNGKDVWIVSHKWNSDEFISFLISSNGLDTVPVISKTGSLHTGISNYSWDGRRGNFIGDLKISPDGKKLAVALNDTAIVEIFDFNDKTGKLSNPFTLFLGYIKPLNLEFSPDGKILYAICEYDSVDNEGIHWTGGQYIKKWNVSVHDEERIKASEFTFDSLGAYSFSLQLGPDGRIYTGKTFSDYISYIPYPNRTGIESGYIENGLRVDTGLGAEFNGLKIPYNQSYLKDNCDPNESFDYPNFEDITNLKLVMNAGTKGKILRLNSAIPNTAGAVWQKNPIYLENGFKTEFCFRISNGTNNLLIDGSLPGADGFAFVIQNSSNQAVGTNGGGLGYSGIAKCLAIEIDLFNNDADGIRDSSGNHIAIICGESRHSDTTTIAKVELPFQLKSDSSIYYGKVFYKDYRLLVYIDTSLNFQNPIIDIPVNIPKLLSSDRAYFGFTSATGNAYQIHDIESWYFCSVSTESRVNLPKIINKTTNYHAYPNPAHKMVSILNIDKVDNVEIIDIFGKCLLKICVKGLSEKDLDIGNINTGTYIILYKNNKNDIINSEFLSIVK